MSQLNKRAACQQEEIENLLAALGGALLRLRHDSLRVRQAIARSGLKDLLDPVLDDHEIIQMAIRAAQQHLKTDWDDGQQRRWE